MVPGPLARLRRSKAAWASLALTFALAGGLTGWLLPGGGLLHGGGRDKVVLALRRSPVRKRRIDPASTDPAPAPPSTLTAPPGTSLVASATVGSLPVYPWPGALRPGLQLANPTTLGAPLTLLASVVEGDWVHAYLPVRPNGAEGWVPLTDVSMSQDPYRISVSILARQLSLYDGAALVTQVPVAVGSPSSPTPLGTFFVTEVLKLTDPQDAYGPYALGLSAFSNTYTSFDGGPGQVAVHGTDQPWVIGGYASHGCVRLSNADITRIAPLVPAGTPVVIGL